MTETPFEFSNKTTMELTSAQYHGLEGIYSSSQLKKMLADEEKFHQEYILREVEKEEVPAFSVGTYFHTAVLEKHLLKDECAVFKGIRRGKVWEQFKADNAGKTIITEGEETQATMLVAAVNNSPVAMSYLEDSVCEMSGFLELMAFRGEIYCKDPHAGKDDAPYLRLDMRSGWTESRKDLTGADLLRVKVRADALNLERGVVLDLKSTTGNAKDNHSMRQKVSAHGYDLSASLYVDIFGALLDTKLSFIWIFASKDHGNCRSYLASDKNILVGRAKWVKAVLKIIAAKKRGWTFPDTLEILEPQPFELEHIKQSELDLL